ncbi:hypothetical protein EDP2_354 [Enterobacter cloacae S611]|uniref:Uncharacterized protein n=1 Tax=Enterobacter cloacae S611 TaxID=1399146 RepID=A0ABN0Q445_ENTCL|nr:hypothetical protein EDP2_354 [Enterobacter cloacae S611]
MCKLLSIHSLMLFITLSEIKIFLLLSILNKLSADLSFFFSGLLGHALNV